MVGDTLMYIIQLAGRARSGKTTMANMIASEIWKMGYIPVILPFAKAIKDHVISLGISKENNPLKYRNMCQTLGAEKRAEDPNFWVNKSDLYIIHYLAKEQERKKEKFPEFEFVLIQDDLRYMNELAWGRDVNAVQLFVSHGAREIEDNNADWRSHESEAFNNYTQKRIRKRGSSLYLLGEEELFSFVIDNSNSLPELKDTVIKNIGKWLADGGLDILGDIHEST